jgi:hypothetical protein
VAIGLEPDVTTHAVQAAVPPPREQVHEARLSNKCSII